MAVTPQEVYTLWCSKRYLQALQKVWQLSRLYTYTSLRRDDMPLRELVLCACREAVAQAAQEEEYTESQQWLAGCRKNFALPAALEGYYDGKGGTSAVEHLSTMIHAHLRCAKVALDHHWTSTTVAPEALQSVAGKTGLPLGFLRDLVQELLPEVPGGPPYRPAVDTCTLAVLLVDEARNAGVVADLTLERLPDGTGALYPAPELSFVYCDAAWQQAMRDASAYVKPTLWRQDWDVRWRLARRGQQPLPPVLEGGSLGAALALGLTKLAGGAKDLDLQGIAITATVDAQGKLGQIKKEDVKLLAAAYERTLPRIHTVVVAEAQRQDVKDIDDSLLQDNPHADLRVICAETLQDAIQFAKRRWRNIDCALPPRHPHFVGRARLTEAVRHFVASQEAGYLVLVGGMGQGKSTWLVELIHAEQARGEEPIYHFIDYHPSATGEPRGLAACLYDRLQRKYAFLEPQEWEDFSAENKLERLLKYISVTELRDGQKEVLYIDAADQAEASAQSPLLPGVLRYLPRGVVGVITSRTHLDWLRTVQAVTVWGMADYVDDRADVQAYLQQRSRHLSPPLPTAFIERIVTQPEPPIFFTVAQCLRHLENLTLPQSDQTALRTDPALWVLPAEDLVQTEARRVVAAAKAMDISETQVWQTLGMLAVAGERLSKEYLDSLGLRQTGTTDHIPRIRRLPSAGSLPIVGRTGVLTARRAALTTGPAPDVAVKGPSPEPLIRMPQICNIPPHLQNQNFVGREATLSTMRRQLSSGHRAALIQALYGLGGVGKTQIAVQYARRYASEYDVVWWVRSEKPQETLIADYAELAQRLQLTPSSLTNQQDLAKAAQRWLAQHTRWLLIFDNVRSPEDIRDFLPRGSTGHVIMTSRYQGAWERFASPIKVRVLPRSMSTQFLMKRTGDKDRGAAERLAEMLGNLPLALEQAGAFILRRKRSIKEYLQLFSENRALLVLSRSDRPIDYDHTVATTWKLSMDQVKAESSIAEEVLALLSFLGPDDIPREILDAFLQRLSDSGRCPVLAPLTLREALDDALAALATYSLVDLSREAVSLHRLVQAVVREEISAETSRAVLSAGVSVLVEYFPTEMDDPLTWRQRARLLPHALSAAGYAEAVEANPEATALLLSGAGLFLRERRQGQAAKDLQTRALAIAQRVCSIDPATLGLIYNNLGRAYASLGDRENQRVNYERSVTVFEEVYGKDHSSVATPLHNLAWVAWGEDLPRARALFERALEIAEKAYGQNHTKVGIIVHHLGEVLTDAGEIDLAKSHLERALAIAREAYGRFHPDVSAPLRDIAKLLMDAGEGNLDAAEAMYREALSSAEGIIDKTMPHLVHPEIVECLEDLGNLLHKRSRPEDLLEAKQLYERALLIQEGIYGPSDWRVSQTLLKLASVMSDRGEFGAACSPLQRALAWYQERGERAGEWNTLLRLAEVALHDGRAQDSAGYLQRALALAQEAKDWQGASLALHKLGQLAAAQGEHAAARRYHEQSLALSEAHQDEPGALASLRELVAVAVAEGDLDAADAYLDRQLARLERRGERDLTSREQNQERRLVISFPYAEGSIDKVSYFIDDRRMNILLLPANSRLTFDDKHVLFSRGGSLPILSQEHKRRLRRRKGRHVSRYVLSFPYREGSVSQVAYTIGGGFLHIILFRGASPIMFDERDVIYNREYTGSE